MKFGADKIHKRGGMRQKSVKCVCVGTEYIKGVPWFFALFTMTGARFFKRNNPEMTAAPNKLSQLTMMKGIRHNNCIVEIEERGLDHVGEIK